MRVVSGERWFGTQKCLNCCICLSLEVVNSAKFFQRLVVGLCETKLGGRQTLAVPPCLRRAAAAANVSNYCAEFACAGLFQRRGV